MNAQERNLWRGLIRATKNIEDCNPEVGMGVSPLELAQRAWGYARGVELSCSEFREVVSIAREISK